MREADACLLLPDDGQSIVVPQSVLSRSSVLLEALNTADDEVLLLKGVIWRWLQGVELLETSGAGSEPYKEVVNNPHLLEFLKVRHV